MRAKEQSDIPSEIIDLYDRLIATNENIERKGASVPYTSVNGHMFTFLSKSGLMGIRLAESDRNEFIKKHKTRLFEAYGTILKEYIEVPGELLKKTGELSKYLDLSYKYAMSLKPKAQKTAASKKTKNIKRKGPTRR